MVQLDHKKKSYTETLVQFCRALRESGTRISVDESISAATALGEIDPTDKDQFYYALYTSLIDNPEEKNQFDELFNYYWEETWRDGLEDESERVKEDVESRAGSKEEKLSEVDVMKPLEASMLGKNEKDGNSERQDENLVSSEVGESKQDKVGTNETDSVFFEGGLEEKAQVMESSFGDFGSDQIVFCVGEIGDKIGTIRGYETIQDKNGLIDLRRSMGVVKELPPNRLPRINKDRSLVKMSMFIDVSRSMIRNIDREFLFKFVFECVRQYTEVRVFFFDTDITEVTEYFQTPSLKSSVEEMERARTKWGSGTRIGECIDKIISKDPFIVDRDTAVVVISDGWDAGDLDVLSKRMAEIKRKSNISIWLNPPASSDNYEPEVRGMKTALPYIDYFFGFNSIEDLEKMTRSLKSSLP
ncbi:MAG: VWA domain-containing protein [Halobacteriales archaeon]|tara:strand:+ start:66 stop:1310 length:1245 start_codon:yes stop_codon:yes gene_type:complete